MAESTVQRKAEAGDGISGRGVFRTRAKKPIKQEEQEGEVPKMNLPSDEGYTKAMDTITETGTGSRENCPAMRDKTLEVLQPSVPEANLAPEAGVT